MFQTAASLAGAGYTAACHWPRLAPGFVPVQAFYGTWLDQAEVSRDSGRADAILSRRVSLRLQRLQPDQAPSELRKLLVLLL